MSFIDIVLDRVKRDGYFFHLSKPTHVRLLDTPRVWGQEFGPGIMPTALARTDDFKRAVIEVVQTTRYRCDVASLNSPDPDWAKVILEGMDLALTAGDQRRGPIQFRFLFGQTPMILKQGLAPNLVDFQGALVRFVRERAPYWRVRPEIWIGLFYRLQAGVQAGARSTLANLLQVLPGGLADLVTDPEDDDVSTKMTWNHSKIIASDGLEAVVGGHNLNMDLFTSYPPVHDVSVVVHGSEARGAQKFLNRMWACGSDLLSKQVLQIPRDAADLTWSDWRDVRDDGQDVRAPADPLSAQEFKEDKRARRQVLDRRRDLPPVVDPVEPPDDAHDAADDRRTLADLDIPVFAEQDAHDEVNRGRYADLGEYRLATRMLSIGKYWTGPDMRQDYQRASEVMKETLIKGASRILRLSQMDLISAWKKRWDAHVVCRWLMDALRANEDLIVEVVVSPLNAGAGAEGDQYSFGSGAVRTYALIEYYMTHDADTDAELPRDQVERARKALERLHIAPFYYTDVPPDATIEGQTYQWPRLPPKGRTLTLKQPPLDQRPPSRGIIGSAALAASMAGGLWKSSSVPSAPGNHSKIMIVDDETYVVGSDNLYPGFLSEFNYLVEGKEAVDDMLGSYWDPLWYYASRHCVNPSCRNGCKALGVKPPGIPVPVPAEDDAVRDSVLLAEAPPQPPRHRLADAAADLAGRVKPGTSVRFVHVGGDSPIECEADVISVGEFLISPQLRPLVGDVILREPAQTAIVAASAWPDDPQATSPVATPHVVVRPVKYFQGTASTPIARTPNDRFEGIECFTLTAANFTRASRPGRPLGDARPDKRLPRAPDVLDDAATLAGRVPPGELVRFVYIEGANPVECEAVVMSVAQFRVNGTLESMYGEPVAPLLPGDPSGSTVSAVVLVPVWPDSPGARQPVMVPHVVVRPQSFYDATGFAVGTSRELLPSEPFADVLWFPLRERSILPEPDFDPYDVD